MNEVGDAVNVVLISRSVDTQPAAERIRAAVLAFILPRASLEARFASGNYRTGRAAAMP
jgi:hypothetical protein